MIQCELPELDLRSFRLQSDLAVISGRIRAIIDQVAIHPDSDRFANGLDHHGVPLADRLLGVVGQIEDASCLTFSGAPLRRWSAATLHIGNADVLEDAPEIAGVPAFHLHLYGARKHSVEGARARRVHEDTGVSRSTRKTVFHLQPVVAVAGVGNEMPARLT